MSEWQPTTLSSCVISNSTSIDQSYKYERILYLDTGSITCNKIESLQEFQLTEAPSRAKRLVKDQDVIYSSVRPNQLHYGFIVNPLPNLVVSTGFVILESKKDKIEPKYLFYFLSQKETTEYLHSIAEASTSAYPSLKPSDIEALDILLPPLPEQKAIAAVLSSLDDKIDLLHRQNKTLEAMAETLFRQWFVEEADEKWEEVMLGDFFPVVTGKKDANFGTENGSFPFFTCSQSPIKAPSYSFDGTAILLAGNGDFNIKRYKGKFEAYQRTYVLIPYDIEYFGLLYTLMKFYLSEITGGFRGSVINFITKGMITDFKFSLPKNRSCISGKLSYFNHIFNKVDANSSQIAKLENLRDTLQPHLMSGEVRVEL